MRSIGRIHAGYILNVPHFSDVIALCPKCGRSIKLGTLRSHDWVHSKSDQQFSQEQIKITFMGTFSINPTFAHWAHWSHLLSVLPMYPACAWWVFGSLSPVSDAPVVLRRLRPDRRGLRSSLVVRGGFEPGSLPTVHQEQMRVLACLFSRDPSQLSRRLRGSSLRRRPHPFRAQTEVTFAEEEALKG